MEKYFFKRSISIALHIPAFFALAIVFAGCSASPPPDMVRVPKGEFIMGSNDTDSEAKALQYGSKKPWFANEKPRRSVYVGGFYIDRYDVTIGKYKEFVTATGHTPPYYWHPYREDLAQYPVSAVSWYDADAYCKWAKKRLPTEAEWEKAARGTDGRTFPWGDDFDIKKVNGLGTSDGPTPVGAFKDGGSPYGAMDMAGNVWQWTSDWYQPYPGNDFKDPDYGEKFKVIRGGGYGGVGHYIMRVSLRSSFRNIAPPDGKFDDIGFRCVWP